MYPLGQLATSQLKTVKREKGAKNAVLSSLLSLQLTVKTLNYFFVRNAEQSIWQSCSTIKHNEL